MLVDVDIPTQTELTAISANIVLPSAYLGDDDTYFNAVVDFNISSGWETGDEVVIYVFGPTTS